jgi:hypothetical protein
MTGAYLQMVWTAKEHQIKIAKEALPIIAKYNIVYLAMEERTGKSITALLIAEAIDKVNSVLIITTKKAKDGWHETLAKFAHNKVYVVTNYHGANKVFSKYDLIILDECHKYISGYPKTSLLWANVAKLTKNIPLIYSSATPYAQGPQLLYNQFKLSSFSPWHNFANFYDWFKFYADRKNGELQTTKISPTQTVIDYSKIKIKEVVDNVKHLFITYTRKDIGFEHEPEDVLHFINLSPSIKEIYNTLIKEKLLAFTHSETGKDMLLVCDVPSKLRWALHMLEGGTLKIENEYINLGNNEKADYILANWGDSKELAIMYYFKADYIKLSKMFSNATLLQATTYAEGIDLSHFKHLIIYSQNHSTAQHTQRRARQANINRKEEIKVHYLLVKNAVSHKAYKQVSINKKDFVDTVFQTL